MAEWTVIISNNSGTDFLVADLGLDIQDGTSVNLHEEAGFAEIADSDDLKAALTAGTLVLNDGASDLTPTEAVDYDCKVEFWFRNSAKDMDKPFFEWLQIWFKNEWGFKKIAYPGRTMSWDEYYKLIN